MNAIAITDQFEARLETDESKPLTPFAGLLEKKFLRLTIYSFLDLETVARKISRLSVKERENLKTSAIAREGKHFELSPEIISNEQSPFWHYGLHLCENLEIDVDHRSSFDITSLVVNKLPQRFYQSRLSLRFYIPYGESELSLSQFCKALRENCPNLSLFKLKYYDYSFVQTIEEESCEFLFSQVERLSLECK